MEVLSNICTNRSNSVRRFQQNCHLRCLLSQLISLKVIEVFCEFIICSVDLSLIYMEVNQSRFEVQFFGCTVSDRFLKAIPAHIAVLIFLSTKRIEGVVISTIDWCASETEQERIRQRLTHLTTKITLLGTVGFIDHSDDVIAIIEDAFCLAKLEDRCYDDFSYIFAENVLEISTTFCLDKIRCIRSEKCS